jgi:phosphoribosyl 1,2-cyclic phosphodiesterase
VKVKIWGARGSIPSPLKPGEVRGKIRQAILNLPDIDTKDPAAVDMYLDQLPPLLSGTVGGNTTCVEIQAGRETFIIDAGSGLRELGLELMKGPCGRGQGSLHFFFSHTHWDHILGFPFFLPAYIPGNQIFIYSVHDLNLALENQQRPLGFPVPFSSMQASMEFISLQPGEPFSVGQVKINTIKTDHPGDAYAYRFEDGYSTFVFASDAEYKQLDEASLRPYLEFFKDAEVLFFDAQYGLRETWESKVDWGHSSAMIGADIARAAGVKKLVLVHHNPTYSDADLLKIQRETIEYQDKDPSRLPCEVIVAYEGLTFDLTPTEAVSLRRLSDGQEAILTPIGHFDERGVAELERQLEHLEETGCLAGPSATGYRTGRVFRLLCPLPHGRGGAGRPASP